MTKPEPTPPRPWMLTDAYRQAEPVSRASIRLSGVENSDLPHAWRLAARALEIDPSHAGACVVAGDLWLYNSDDIGYEDHTETEAAAAALPYYERALEVEPLHSDAWAGRAHALCRLGRYEEAHAAAEAGLAALPWGVDYLWHAETREYVDRELWRGLVEALLGMGRRDEARRMLKEALSEYPGQEYLAELAPEVDESR